jgi:hypothetical protein
VVTGGEVFFEGSSGKGRVFMSVQDVRFRVSGRIASPEKRRKMQGYGLTGINTHHSEAR